MKTPAIQEIWQKFLQHKQLNGGKQFRSDMETLR
jgi:hypothetical protein